MFKNKLKEYRLRAGLTRSELAKKIDCHTTYVGKLENGTREPNSTMLGLITQALHCTPNDLLLDNSEEVKE